MNSVLVYSTELRSNSLASLIDAFPGFVTLDVIPRLEMLKMVVEREQPDILVVENLKLEELESIKETCEKWKLRVLLITPLIDDKGLLEIFRKGFDGIIEGSVTPYNLFDALTQLSRNGVYICHLSQKKLIQSLRILNDSGLTRKELKILAELREGKTYSKIASEFCLSGNTIRTHIYNIYNKLNVKSKSEAIQLALERRII